MYSLVLAALVLTHRSEMRLDTIRESLTGTHRTYTQLIDGIEVVGGGRVERTRNGITETTWEHESRVPETRPVEALITPPAGGKLVWLDVDGEARKAFRVVVPGNHPLERYANYIDAATGALLRSDPLFFAVKARVFDPNPVAKLNDPALRDQNDAAGAVPDAAYSIVDLPDLPDSGPLSGPNVEIFSTNSIEQPVDISTGLMFDRSQRPFEQINAYYHIDHNARYLQSLGYTGSKRIVAYAIPVDPHASPADNSLYLPGPIAGQGQLFFGTGGTDDAEDSDIMLHEFGHAIQDWIAPNTFTGPTFGEARALGEGFGDYWSFSSNWEATAPSGRDQYCIADWDARCGGDDPSQNCAYPVGADCLRRVDSTKTMADFQRSGGEGTEHENGMIWSSALREIFDAMRGRYGDDPGKRHTDTLVIEGTFGAPPTPTFAAMAKKLLDADRILYGGADVSNICAAMITRGILAAGDCNGLPRGDTTLFQAPQHGVAIRDSDPTGVTLTTTISDPRTIQDLYVSLDIAHTARGDLQISLTGPDGTTAVLQEASIDRTADIHVTYGLDATPADSLEVFRGKPAAGTWTLKVADVHPLDVGSVTSWGLIIRFAGDQPVTQRPGTSIVIPAVAHAPGANGTNFVSDVRILNRSSSTAQIAAVFAPSAQDGSVSFAAVNLSIAPQQVLALDDVVARTFETVGTGQLAIGGNADLVVTSRTYTKSANGTYGQFIPAADTSGALFFIPQLQVNDAFRSNVGFAEAAGASGTVRVTILDSSGAALEQHDLDVVPFEHLQVGITARGAAAARIEVASGNAKIVAYGSVVDNVSGDPIFIPGQPPPAGPRALFFPAIHAPGADGTFWRTDVGLLNLTSTPQTALGETLSLNQSTIVQDVLPAGAALIALDTPMIVTTRTWTSSAAGSYGQFVLPVTASGRDIIQIDDSPSFRTNIGLMNPSTKGVAAVVAVFDGAGNAAGQRTVILDGRGYIQFPLRSITGHDLVDGHVVIEGPVIGYASVIDNVSQDPICVPAR
jgi:subtilisin-like proprotein convertase family protein